MEVKTRLHERAEEGLECCPSSPSSPSRPSLEHWVTLLHLCHDAEQPRSMELSASAEGGHGGSRGISHSLAVPPCQIVLVRGHCSQCAGGLGGSDVHGGGAGACRRMVEGAWAHMRCRPAPATVHEGHQGVTSAGCLGAWGGHAGRCLHRVKHIACSSEGGAWGGEHPRQPKQRNEAVHTIVRL